jgi:hypothetical protein
MKKKMQRLQLKKSTISNLDQAGMRRIAGGTNAQLCNTNNVLCITLPAGCTTTQISNCTACYSCIECAAPPDSMFLPCGKPIDI